MNLFIFLVCFVVLIYATAMLIKSGWSYFKAHRAGENPTRTKIIMYTFIMFFAVCIGVYSAAQDAPNHSQKQQATQEDSQPTLTPEEDMEHIAKKSPSNAAQSAPPSSSAATSDTTHKATSSAASLQKASYLGNPKTKKFHRPTCRTIKHPENFVAINSRNEAVTDGYTPCGVCKP